MPSSKQNIAPAMNTASVVNAAPSADAQELSQDPRFQQIMQDPEIQKEIASHDIAKLMSNPKMMTRLKRFSVSWPSQVLRKSDSFMDKTGG